MTSVCHFLAQKEPGKDKLQCFQRPTVLPPVLTAPVINGHTNICDQADISDQGEGDKGRTQAR